MTMPAIQSALAVRTALDGLQSELRSAPGASPNGAPSRAAQTDGAGAASPEDGWPPEFYVSPKLSFDAEANMVVVSFLDPGTGDVQRQYPSETQVEAYRRQQSAEGTSRARSEPQDGIAEAPSAEIAAAARLVESTSANAPTGTEATERPSSTSGPRVAIVA